MTPNDGLWPNKNLSNEDEHFFCNRKTDDGGASCSSDRDCDGSCLAPDNSFPGQETSGRCSSAQLREAGQLIVDLGVVRYATASDEISQVKRTRLESLTQNWNKWVQKAVTDYNVTLEQSCYCLSAAYFGPNRVYVREGKVVSVIYQGADIDRLKTGERLTGQSALDSTIDEVFRELGATIMAASDISTLEIAYDDQWGFPSSIEYDDPNMYDEEYSLVVSGFRKFE